MLFSMDQLLRDCNVVITRCRERAEEADQL